MFTNSANVRRFGSPLSVNWHSTLHGLLSAISTKSSRRCERPREAAVRKAAGACARSILRRLARIVRRSGKDLVGFRFHEAQGHAVGFADREILVLVLVAQSQGRRQRPHALGMIVIVLRVRVDLALAVELETGIGGELDDVILGQVTAVLD